MIIIQDTREKVGHKNHILKYFEKHNIQVIRQKLNVGDYCIKGKEYVTIDLKRNLLELAQNLFSDSIRFQKECIRAKNNGITPILPRNIDFEIRKQSLYSQTWVAFSLNEFKQLFIDSIEEKSNHYYVVVDIANGHMMSLYNTCKKAKEIAD